MSTKFKLTKEHLILIQHMYVGWQDCEHGAPEIDPKRPYGNSYVEGDLAEILGMTPTEPDGELSEEQKRYLNKIHSETEIALQVFLLHAQLDEGEFCKDDKYNRRSWKKS